MAARARTGRAHRGIRGGLGYGRCATLRHAPPRRALPPGMGRHGPRLVVQSVSDHRRPGEPREVVILSPVARGVLRPHRARSSVDCRPGLSVPSSVCV